MPKLTFGAEICGFDFGQKGVFCDDEVSRVVRFPEALYTYLAPMVAQECFVKLQHIDNEDRFPVSRSQITFTHNRRSCTLENQDVLVKHLQMASSVVFWHHL